MIRLSFFVNGQEQTPTNYQEASIDLTFDPEGDGSTLALNTNQWTFDLEQSKEVLKHVNGGLTGGLGVFHGLPFETVIRNLQTNQSISFKQYIDYTQDMVLGRDFATVTAEDRRGINFLSDKMDSFSFQYLFEQAGVIRQTDFVTVPYVINSVPNGKDAMITLISTAFIVSELSTALEDISAEAIRALDPFSTIGSVLVLAFRIIKVIALIIVLLKLIKDLIDFMIQPVKYHKGMYVKDLFIRSCEHLGLTFKSPILLEAPFNKLLLLPSKSNALEDAEGRLFGFLEPANSQTGYYDGTFGDLLRAMRTMFNAKVIIKDGELWFVRKDFVFATAQFNIPKIQPCDYRLNADEIQSNYVIKFQTDVIEKNTIQDFTGNIFRAQHELINRGERDLNLLKNLSEQAIPFALGRRKEKLNIVERIVDVFLQAADGILNALITAANAVVSLVNMVGKIINLVKRVLGFFGFKTKGLKAPKLAKIKKVDFGSILNDRIGMLMLEDDNFNTPKLFLFNSAANARDGKIPTDNITTVNARYLWEKFHFINSFAPSVEKPNANQWFRYQSKNVPLCFDDFVKIKNNNSIFDRGGNTAIIEKLTWNIYQQTADIDYRVNKLYTKNIKITLHEPTGY